MKMKYEVPNMKISVYNLENIITTSGAGSTDKTLKEKMQADGYNVTSIDLSGIDILF